MQRKILKSEHVFVNQKELAELCDISDMTLRKYTRAGILKVDGDGLYDLMGGSLADRVAMIKMGCFRQAVGVKDE